MRRLRRFCPRRNPAAESGRDRVMVSGRLADRAKSLSPAYDPAHANPNRINDLVD
jgi:hypothetical protein